MATNAADLAIVIRAYDETRAAFASANNQLSALRNQASQTTSAVSKVGSGFGGMAQGIGQLMVAVGAMQALRAAASALGDSVIGYNAMLEQSRIAWTNMLQSASAADVIIARMQGFAAVTPFRYEDLEKSVRQLTAMGFAVDKILGADYKGLAADIGNAAAYGASGAQGIESISRALGQMHTAGRLNAQDMNQLTEAGLPAWQMLADYIGKPIGELRQLSEQGKIAGDTMVAAFQKWAQAPNIANMMTAQSQTFLGLISTIQDNLQMGLASAFEPAFNQVKRLTEVFTNFTSATSFTQAMSQISGVVKGVISVFTGISPAVAQAAAAFAAGAGGALVFAAAIAGVAIAVGVLSSPIVAIAALVGLLAVAWQTNFMGIQNTVNTMLPGIVGFVMDMLGGLIDWWDTNVPLLSDAIDNVLSLINDMWVAYGGDMLDIVAAIWSGTSEIVSTAADAINGLIASFLQAASGDWSSAWQTFVDIMVSAWNWIIQAAVDGVNGVIGAIQGLVSALAGSGIADSPLLKEFLKITDAAKGLIKIGGDAVKVAGGSVIGGWAGGSSSGTGGPKGEGGAAPWSVEAKQTGRQKLEGLVRGVGQQFSGNAKPDWQRQNEARAAEEAARRLKAGTLGGGSGTSVPGAGIGGGGGGGGAGQKVTLPVADIVKALVSLHPATIKAAADVKTWEGAVASTEASLKANAEAVRGLNREIKANQDGTKAAQAVLQGMQDKLTALQTKLTEAQTALQRFAQTKLTGQGESDMRINAVDDQIKRVQLAKSLGVSLASVIAQYPRLTTGAEDYLATLPQTEKALGKVRDQLQNQSSLSFDEKSRLLTQAAAPASPELDYSTALAGVTATKGQVDQLTGSIATQQAAIAAQTEVVKAWQSAGDALQLTLSGVQTEGDNLNQTLSAQQDQLKLTKTDYDSITTALTQAYTWLLEDRQKFIEYGGEALVQAAVIDDNTRKMVGALDEWAKGNTATVAGAVTEMTTFYTTEVAKSLAELDKLNMTVTTTHIINTIEQNNGTPTNSGASTSFTPKLAKGTPNWPGGTAIVGEAGPELINLPQGSSVVPLGGGGSPRAGSAGGSQVNVYVTVHGSVTSENDLVETIRTKLIGRPTTGGRLGVFG